ncbi:hypothetical protein BKA62DRAFT_757261 [Auriculariales sp. MPI-PUGE-AT-0066]|nr:hypothetical protein BKA62DRAFT_757261 [Auriculariales sp. MPI-PUGE-AT-0066]
MQKIDIKQREGGALNRSGGVGRKPTACNNVAPPVARERGPMGAQTVDPWMTKGAVGKLKRRRPSARHPRIVCVGLCMIEEEVLSRGGGLTWTGPVVRGGGSFAIRGDARNICIHANFQHSQVYIQARRRQKSVTPDVLRAKVNTGLVIPLPCPDSCTQREQLFDPRRHPSHKIFRDVNEEPCPATLIHVVKSLDLRSRRGQTSRDGGITVSGPSISLLILSAAYLRYGILGHGHCTTEWRAQLRKLWQNDNITPKANNRSRVSAVHVAVKKKLEQRALGGLVSCVLSLGTPLTAAASTSKLRIPHRCLAGMDGSETAKQQYKDVALTCCGPSQASSSFLEAEEAARAKQPPGKAVTSVSPSCDSQLCTTRARNTRVPEPALRGANNAAIAPSLLPPDPAAHTETNNPCRRNGEKVRNRPGPSIGNRTLSARVRLTAPARGRRPPPS